MIALLVIYKYNKSLLEPAFSTWVRNLPRKNVKVASHDGWSCVRSWPQNTALVCDHGASIAMQDHYEIDNIHTMHQNINIS